jgi:hypothetical protein
MKMRFCLLSSDVSPLCPMSITSESCSLFVSSFSSLLMERILRGLTDWYRVFKWHRSLALLSCKGHKPQKKIPASSS